jgi:hypothetical protein
MGALEQLQTKGFGNRRSQTPDSSGTLGPVESPTAQRIRLVTEFFISQMNSSDVNGRQDKLRRMLTAIAREAIDEMGDAPEEAIAFYFCRAANLTYWSATGEKIQNLPWPHEFDPPAELSAGQGVPSIEE